MPYARSLSQEMWLLTLERSIQKLVCVRVLNYKERLRVDTGITHMILNVFRLFHESGSAENLLLRTLLLKPLKALGLFHLLLNIIKLEIIVHSSGGLKV